MHLTCLAPELDRAPQRHRFLPLFLGQIRPSGNPHWREELLRPLRPGLIAHVDEEGRFGFRIRFLFLVDDLNRLNGLICWKVG